MMHWQTSMDLEGVRGEEALSKLPEPERPPWQNLWDEVADTVARTQKKKPPEKQPPSK